MIGHPKSAAQRNPHLLAMAKGKPCLLMAVHNCETTRGDTTVAAHSNWSDLGGKGAHRKADDSYTVWSCAPCHMWLDQSGAPKAEKRRAWLAGHERQRQHWADIASGKEPGIEKDRKAAQWAMDRL